MMTICLTFIGGSLLDIFGTFTTTEGNMSYIRTLSTMLG